MIVLYILLLHLSLQTFYIGGIHLYYIQNKSNGKYNICLRLRHYQPDTRHHHLNHIWPLPISVYDRENDSYRFLSLALL